ncbi:MAG: efflux RND transporter permease subunit [Bacteroidales bacterium]|nr:efflux RND transporter permease subunit [Bacteroidales bacterium]
MNTEKEFSLTNIAVKNRTTVYIFTIILIIAGIVAYQSTPKEKFPEVTFPFFSIATIYVGTSPEDMENLVTYQLEKELKGLKGVKNISSNSIQDFSLIFLEFDTNIDDNRAMQDVKDAVDKAKTNLPPELAQVPNQMPEVTRIDLSEIPILNINLSGELGLVKMKEYAESLQDRIESLQEVTRVDIVGALDREIQVNVDLYKMQAAGITFDHITNAIRLENMTITAGMYKMGTMERNMRVVGEFTDPDQLNYLLLKEGVYLRDIAEIRDDFRDRESYSRMDGKDVVTLNVIKKSGENLIVAIDKIKEIIADFEENTPGNFEIKATGDQSTMTRNNVSDLFNTIILGFLIVTLVLMFFMGIDNALFVAVAIPLSMVIAFIFIPLIGFTMNMVVLMAFILVLGIVVDNSIVIVENIYRIFMTTPNLNIMDATRRSVGEVALPVFTGTLTTIMPFVPLAFWPGLIGNFMVYIPVTLIITLLASMLVAYVMNPVFAVSFMKYRGEKAHERKLYRKESIFLISITVIAVILYVVGIFWAGNLLAFLVIIWLFTKFVIFYFVEKFQQRVIPVIMNAYKSTLSFLLKGIHPYLIIGLTVFLFFFTFYMLGVRTPRVVFFPEGEPNNIFIYISMPSGTDIEVTNRVTQQAEDSVFAILGYNNTDVESVITNVAINAGQNIFERSTQARLAKIAINFQEYKYRTGKSTTKYLEEMRQRIVGIPGAKIIVDREQSGPPTGKAINLEIRGQSDRPYRELIALSESTRLFIDSLNIHGIEDLRSDVEMDKPEIVVKIDRIKANQLGISTVHIGSMLRTALAGTTASKYREGEDEYPINVRLDKQYRDHLDQLLSITAVLPGGQDGSMREIPLSSVAEIEYQNSYGGVIHQQYRPTVTISSNVLTGYNANEIVQQLRTALNSFDLPDGYEITFTGEQEDQAEASSFLTIAFLIAISVVFLILVSQFNSLSKPVIIMLQVLFSMIGIFLLTIIFGMSISVIMTGMGLVAVIGIVVKNAIILIDYIDILINRGYKFKDAVVIGSATRLTPVILTAFSTIFGLLPLAIGMNINFYTIFTELNPHIYFGGDSASFWNPLAWTIIFGLSFATFLTLVVIPAMYYLIYRKRHTEPIAVQSVD